MASSGDLSPVARQDSFVSRFLGAHDTESSPSLQAGYIAVAKDNARQIVGNIINNYFGSPEDSKFQREWPSIIEWLVPTQEAVTLQARIHREARDSQAT